MKYVFVAAMLLFVGSADAQYCGRNLRQQFFQPVQSYVPVQNYAYDYYIQQPLVVGIPVQNFGLNYYYSVGDELREERIAELVAQQLTLKLNAPAPAEAAPAEPPQEVSKNLSSTEVDTNILTLFTKSCIMCHGAGKDGPGVKLFNEDGSLYVDADPLEELLRRDAIYEATFGGNSNVSQMPKNGSALSDEEVDLIRQWKNQFTGELR